MFFCLNGLFLTPIFLRLRRAHKGLRQGLRPGSLKLATLGGSIIHVAPMGAVTSPGHRRALRREGWRPSDPGDVRGIPARALWAHPLSARRVTTEPGGRRWLLVAPRGAPVERLARSVGQRGVCSVTLRPHPPRQEATWAAGGCNSQKVHESSAFFGFQWHCVLLGRWAVSGEGATEGWTVPSKAYARAHATELCTRALGGGEGNQPRRTRANARVAANAHATAPQPDLEHICEQCECHPSCHFPCATRRRCL